MQPVPPADEAPRSPQWKWAVCGLLLLATMLLYMDRQTLAQTSAAITKHVGINDQQYGRLEFGFGMAFAAGAVLFGFLVDRIPVRWLYPIALCGWSLAGVATAHSSAIGAALVEGLTPLLGPPEEWLLAFTNLSREQAAWDPERQMGLAGDFLGLFACRVVLGIFEAGHWPCALVTTQRILSRSELPLGNSILQSGASIGAILTPPIVLCWNLDQPGQWQRPFVVVGFVGMSWVVPWLLLVGRNDLRRDPAPSAGPQPVAAPPAIPEAERSAARIDFARRFAACLAVVILINLTWQFYRAWLPRFLRMQHGYGEAAVGWFTSGFYVASDVGCLAVGATVRFLSARGWDVHRSRVATFAACAALTGLGFVVAPLPPGPWLMGLLLLVAAGSLGLFPNYYAFSQDLSRRHQGKITGTLGCLTWICSALMQESVGRHLERTKSYEDAIRLAAAAPIVALGALVLLWPRDRGTASSESR